jgi:hypothetical protein
MNRSDTRDAASVSMSDRRFWEWNSPGAVHLRGKPRKSRDYPWKSFCRNTACADNGEVTDDPAKVTCHQCFDRLRVKPDSRPILYLNLYGYSLAGLLADMRAMLNDHALLVKRLIESERLAKR